MPEAACDPWAHPGWAWSGIKRLLPVCYVLATAVATTQHILVVGCAHIAG